MKVKHLVVLLALLVVTCAEPKPAPASVHRTPMGAQPTGTFTGAVRRQPEPMIPDLPAQPRIRKSGSGSGLPPITSRVGPRVFDRLTPQMELFRITTKPGVFSFCLSGSKPNLDPLFFQVLLGRDGHIYRLDGVQGVAAEDTAFSVCAAMARSEQVAPLRAGEVVTLEATWRTRGPVTLTLTVEDAPP